MSVNLPAEARSKLVAFETQVDAAKNAISYINSRLAGIERSRTASADPTLASDEVDVLTTQKREAMAKREQLSQLLGRLQGWIETTNGHFAMAAPVMVELEPNETLAQAITRLRGEILGLERDLELVTNAPPPKAALKDMVRTAVQSWVGKGTPRISLHGGDMRISFADPSAYTTSLDDIVRIVVWANADQVTALLDAQIDRMELPSMALTLAEKTERSADLNRQLVQLQRQEEAAIEKALQAGVVVARRPEADPRAVLGIEAKRVRTAAAA
jgi:hypothetical protein